MLHLAPTVLSADRLDRMSQTNQLIRGADKGACPCSTNLKLLIDHLTAPTCIGHFPQARFLAFGRPLASV